MTSQSDFVQPPHIATWLLSLFALPEDFESIAGDLLEEFSLLAPQLGESAARKWYWRQAMKTVPQLAGASVRAAPWVTGAAVGGGFLLRRLVGPLVGPAIFSVLGRYEDFFEHHFGAYVFFTSIGIDIGHIITFLFIGFVVALAARRNEMTATITLGFIFEAMAIVGSVYAITRTGNDALLWRLSWYFADSFAIVIAGAIVRTHRLAATSRPSNN
jgi:hypothetical protein